MSPGRNALVAMLHHAGRGSREDQQVSLLLLFIIIPLGERKTRFDTGWTSLGVISRGTGYRVKRGRVLEVSIDVDRCGLRVGGKQRGTRW